MRIKPNRTIVEGRVSRIDHAEDGIGAEIEIEVDSAKSAEGHDDFIGAKPGARVRMFAAVPGEIKAGGRYRLTASVLGGPGGERVVVESAKKAKPKPKPEKA